MVSDDGAHRGGLDDSVAMLTKFGTVVWSQGPARVTTTTPCAIDSTGVTLYRWPRRRTIFIPLERVDGFDVVLRAPAIDLDPGYATVQRLALLTRDGKTLLVSGQRNVPRAPALHARATQLNNHIKRIR